jgi:hypothetical protein
MAITQQRATKKRNENLTAGFGGKDVGRQTEKEAAGRIEADQRA